MKGFDAEFINLDHYIRVITDRIWEGRRIDDIALYYSDDCAVQTPSHVSIGIEPVISGTKATLIAFPDRRLLAEDVIISGDEHSGYLSSHRIFSPMTHAGDGSFGPPSFRPVFARTIADCVCINNKIVHEWLVRDQAAIARQIGLNEQIIAKRWLAQRGNAKKAPMPPAPGGYVSFIDAHPLAQRYSQYYQTLWSQTQTDSAAAGLTAQTHHENVIVAVPGGETRVGTAALAKFWTSIKQALPSASCSIEHLVANERAGRATSVAIRWRVQAAHSGLGHYGEPGGANLEIMGICHADFIGDQIVREWVLFDDVAVWMQIYDH